MRMENFTMDASGYGVDKLNDTINTKETDSNGKPMEKGRSYVAELGGRSVILIADSSPTGFWLRQPASANGLHPSQPLCQMLGVGYLIKRLSDWVRENNNESLLDSLANICERSENHSQSIEQLHAECVEIIRLVTPSMAVSLAGRLLSRDITPEQLLAEIQS